MEPTIITLIDAFLLISEEKVSQLSKNINDDSPHNDIIRLMYWEKLVESASEMLDALQVLDEIEENPKTLSQTKIEDLVKYIKEQENKLKKSI